MVPLGKLVKSAQGQLSESFPSSQLEKAIKLKSSAFFLAWVSTILQWVFAAQGKSVSCLFQSVHKGKN